MTNRLNQSEKFSKSPQEVQNTFLNKDYTRRDPDQNMETFLKLYQTDDTNSSRKHVSDFKLTNQLGIEIKDLQSVSSMNFNLEKTQSLSTDHKKKLSSKNKLKFKRVQNDEKINKSFSVYERDVPKKDKLGFFPKQKAFETINDQKTGIEKINLFQRKMKFKKPNTNIEMIGHKLNYLDLFDKSNKKDLEMLEYLEKENPLINVEPTFFKKDEEVDKKEKIQNNITSFMKMYTKFGDDSLPDKTTATMAYKIIKSQEKIPNEYRVSMKEIRMCLFKSMFCDIEKNRILVVDTLKRLSEATYSPNAFNENLIYHTMPYFDIVKTICSSIDTALEDFQKIIDEKDKVIEEYEEFKKAKEKKNEEKNNKKVQKSKVKEVESSELEQVKEVLDKEKRANCVLDAQVKMLKREMRDFSMISKSVKISQMYELLNKLLEKHIETETQIRRAEDALFDKDLEYRNLEKISRVQEEKQKENLQTIEMNNQRTRDYKEQLSNLKESAAKYMKYTPRPSDNLIKNSIEQFTTIHTELDENIERMSTVDKLALLKKSIKSFFFKMKSLANSDRWKDHLILIDFFKNFKEKNTYNNPKFKINKNESF